MARKGLILFLSSWLTLALSFISSVIIARSLGVAGLGKVVLIISFPVLLDKLCGFGLGPAIIYYVSGKRYGLGEMLVHVGVFIGAVSFLVAILFWWQGQWFVSLLFKEAVPPIFLVWMALWALPFLMCASIGGGVLAGLGHVWYASSVAVLQGLVRLILLLIFVVWLGGGIVTVVALTTVTSVLSGTLAAGLLAITDRPRLHWRTAVFADIFRYGVQQHGSFSLSLVFKRLDHFLLAYFLNMQAVGIYSVANSLSQLLLTIPRAVQFLLMGYVAKDKKQAPGRVTKATRWTVVFIVGGAIGMAIVGKPLILWMYGSEFMLAVKPFLVLLPGVVMWGIATLLSAALSGLGLLKLRIFVWSLGASVKVGLSIWLIPLLGVVGSAWATTLGASLMAACCVLFLCRYLKVSAFRMLVFQKEDLMAVRKSLAAAKT